MKMKRNTKAMTQYNMERGATVREKVLAAIEQCKKDNDISTTRVCKIAGIHRSYFTKHPEMRKALDTAKGIVNRRIKKRKQNDDSKEVIIRSLYAQNTILEGKITSMDEYKKYKDMYESKCGEVEKLKKQLDAAYRNSDLLNF